MITLNKKEKKIDLVTFDVTLFDTSRPKTNSETNSEALNIINSVQQRIDG